MHSGFSSLRFHQRGRNHGEGGGEEAGADSLERGDAGVLACDPAGDGDEESFVERDDEDENEVRDGLEGCWRDLEGGGETSVHGGSLLDGEGLELSKNCVEDDGAGEYGDDGDEDLHLLHLRYSAEPPWTLLDDVVS